MLFHNYFVRSFNSEIEVVVYFIFWYYNDNVALFLYNFSLSPMYYFNQICNLSLSLSLSNMNNPLLDSTIASEWALLFIPSAQTVNCIEGHYLTSFFVSCTNVQWIYCKSIFFFITSKYNFIPMSFLITVGNGLLVRYK